MSVQISAYIDDSVKDKLERFSTQNGYKKGFLIENALEYYLGALENIPASYVVPSSLVVSSKEFKNILSLEDEKPTDSLKELMS